MSNEVTLKVDIPTSDLKAKAERTLKKIKPMVKQRIIRDCNKNVPFKTGALQKSAVRWAPLTNDYIMWDTSYAHFQHTGRVMIGRYSHSPWAPAGETKIYTDRKLTHRQGTSQWIPKTFAQKASSWDKLAGSLFKKEFNK